MAKGLIAPGKPSDAYDHTPTFVGILRKYFFEHDEHNNNIGISKDWGETTKENYLGQYNSRLIPTIDSIFGKERPMAEFTADDFEKILSELCRKYNYRDSTKQHYRHLMWVVYRAGFEHGHYEDRILWPDVIDLEGDDEDKKNEIRAKVMTKIRKSFDIDEEIAIVKWFLQLNPETASGEDIGLLFMFFAGFRGNEACGTDIRSVYVLDKYPEVPVVDMVQSTTIGKNATKAGGKTSNAPRTVPLLLSFFNFLKKRRDYLSRLVEMGTLQLPAGMKNVDDLPYVCKGHNYTTRATTDDLSKAGRSLFLRIGIEKNVLSVLHQILFSSEFATLQIEEKDPTTYLNRRNFVTHLKSLGFSDEEIQYLVGHEIENPDEDRNAFSDPDALRHLWLRLQMHPVNLLLNGEQAAIKDYQLLSPNEDSYVAVQELQLNSSSETSRDYCMIIKAGEPCQKISLKIVGEDVCFSSTVRGMTIPVKDRRTALIHSQIWDAYKKHLG